MALRHWRLLLVGMVLGIVGGVSPAWAVTYIIDQAHGAANDTNPGTEALPWQTLYAVNTHTFVPGDVIRVKTGTYTVTTGGSWSSPAIAPRQAGTPANPIVLEAFPGHTPVVDGQLVMGRSKIGCVAAYCIVRGFRLINTGDHGPICGGTAAARLDGCVLERNTCERVTASTTVNPSCYKLYHSNAAIIRDNVADNSMVSNPGQNVAGIATEHAWDSVIENNEIWGFSTGIFDKYGGNRNVVRYNYIHQMDRGIIAACFGSETTPCSDGFWHHNIIAFSTNEGISVSTATNNTQFPGYRIERNTLHDIDQSGIMVGMPTPPAVVLNNLIGADAITARAALIFGTLGTTNGNNTWPRIRWVQFEYGSGGTQVTWTTLAAWQATGRDLNGFAVDPQYVGPLAAGTRDPTVYRLAAASPLRNIAVGGGHVGAYDTDTTVVGVRPVTSGQPPAAPSNAAVIFAP